MAWPGRSHGASPLVSFTCFCLVAAATSAGTPLAGAPAQQPSKLGRALLAAAPSLPLGSIKLPRGFQIELYVNETVPARFFALGQHGGNKETVVFVSSTKSGVITALVDRGGGKPVTACTLLSGRDTPNGVAYDSTTGSLYVSEVRRITRFDGADSAALAGCDASQLHATVIADASVLPEQASHRSRFLGLGPDGKLYVTVAAPYNVAACRDPYCTIHRMNKNGSGVEIFARGIRNAAGWDWHPATKALVFAGMERDWMGNNLPDDILGIVDRPGMDLKWPYCHWEGAGPPEARFPGPGTAIPDPNMTLPGVVPEGQPRPSDAVLAQRCAAEAPPVLQALGPHVAPLGVVYWPNSSHPQRWPADYDNSFFVGEHGSWNREDKIGYRIANVKLSADNRSAIGHTVFAQGWLRADGTSWGRPVGLLRLPDESMLVADDMNNVVYRISRMRPPPPAPKRRPRPPPPPPLAQGMYTLQLAGRQSCPVRGYASVKGCNHTSTAVSLSLEVTSSGLQLWQVIGQPLDAVHLRSTGRAGCPAFVAVGSTTCSSTGVRLVASQSRNTTWALKWGPTGGYYIVSRV